MSINRGIGVDKDIKPLSSDWVDDLIALALRVKKKDDEDDPLDIVGGEELLDGD